MTLGEKLLELRRKAAMSQDVLAERLDVSRQAVSKWERDEAVPETDKIVRIAQIFGVTTDYLLLEDAPPQQEAPTWQAPPQYQAPAGFGRAERFIRSHGYKFGYILIAIGTLICLFSLGMRLLWPVIAEGFFSGFGGGSLFDDFGGSSIILDENGNPIGSFEDIFGDGPVYDIDGKPIDDWGVVFQNPNDFGNFFGDFHQSAQQGMRNAIQMQANLFLLGLLPGLFLIAAGIFVVVKGKKIARETAA